MSFVSHLRCMAAGCQYPADKVMNLCPQHGRPVAMILDLPRLAAARPGQSWYDPKLRNMWRFGGLLALDRADPSDRACIVSLGEGGTPLRAYPDLPAARAAGLRLFFKDEGRAEPGFGANPTQSFKDRGMAMTVSQAKRLGLTRLAVPTQGNAGDSLAEYALAAGIAAAVVMPADTPMPILGRVAALARLHPEAIRLELVEGSIREAGEFVRERLLPEGYFNVATFQEPGWRIEGKKTLGLELAEDGSGGWRLPDAIVYPTGGGTGLLGMWKAFAELEALGLIAARRPKMFAVQSAATAPLVEAFMAGRADTQPVTPGATLATGLNVPGGVGHFRVLEILRESGGCALAVGEEDIARHLHDCHQATGWWLCPEGAACLAAIAPLVERGALHAGERVVVVNTGSAEKYLPNLRHLL